MEEAKGSTTSSRWNPTKEQIAVLEELYRQGMCTPSAEQIQQITGKLSEYGSIEGKNVFYWFQNHKARQRQRQKQENFAYFSRLLHRAPPQPQPIVQSPPSPAPLAALPPSACTNVVCSPCCLPVPEVGNVGYCQPHYPNILLLGAIERKPTSQLPRMTERSGGIHPEAYIHSSSIQGHHHGSTGHAINGGNVAVGANVNDSITHQMLELFPLHPTGFLEDRSGSTLTTASGGTESLEEGEEGEASVELGLANFFCAPRMS